MNEPTAIDHQHQQHQHQHQHQQHHQQPQQPLPHLQYHHHQQQHIDAALVDAAAAVTVGPPVAHGSIATDGDVGDAPIEEHKDDIVGDAGDASKLSASSKERQSLTLDQRRALRLWARSQPVRPSHKACIEWFQAEYHQTISQSTVSHSLSPKYARLDGDPQLSGSRLRFGNWPDVEKLVLLWYQQSVNTGRNPSNEELAAKAKAIFQQLPRYKDEQPPEFSPGWIHRFKKRYGLLVRRQRRRGSAPNPADDIPYLVDAVPRFLSIVAETSPAAIREAIQRVVGVEATLATCARVRDMIVRRAQNTQQLPQHAAAAATNNGLTPMPPGLDDTGNTSSMYAPVDPEAALENALRQAQREEAEAEAEAAAVREERERAERGLQPLDNYAGHHAYPTPTGPGSLSTPTRANMAGALGVPAGDASTANGTGPRYATTPTVPASATDDLNLTSMPSTSSMGPFPELPRRCPFCVNPRMLRSIKEAVDHMSTHVQVDD